MTIAQELIEVESHYQNLSRQAEAAKQRGEHLRREWLSGLEVGTTVGYFDNPKTFQKFSDGKLSLEGEDSERIALYGIHPWTEDHQQRYQRRLRQSKLQRRLLEGPNQLLSTDQLDAIESILNTN